MGKAIALIMCCMMLGCAAKKPVADVRVVPPECVVTQKGWAVTYKGGVPSSVKPIEPKLHCTVANAENH